MIGIQKVSQDSGSAIVIKEDVGSDIYDVQARASRTATLDGGAIVEHYGYTASDLTLRVSTRTTAEQEAAIRTMFENETFVLITTKTGAYYGVISSLRALNGILSMTLLVKE